MVIPIPEVQVMVKDETIKPSKGRGCKQVFAILTVLTEPIVEIVWPSKGDHLTFNAIDITAVIKDKYKMDTHQLWGTVLNNPIEDFVIEGRSQLVANAKLIVVPYTPITAPIWAVSGVVPTAPGENLVLLTFYDINTGARLGAGNNITGLVKLWLRDGYETIEKVMEKDIYPYWPA